MKKLLPIILALALMCGLLSGCRNTESGDTGNNVSGNAVGSADPAKVDFSHTDKDMFTDRDLRTEYDERGSITVQLNGTSAISSSDSVKISGNTVTITEDATYIISGTLDNGMIIVNAPDTAKMQIVLNGVNINCETSAPLYILEADKVFLTLADGTENTLSNGGAFTAIDDNNIDAAIFSKQDLTINGSGSLKVTSPAGHGIVSKDDLVITGGTLTVASASHGLDANDSVRIANASVTIDAGKDGIHAENKNDSSRGFVYIASGSIKIEAEGDGIDASAYMQIENGTIDILAGGGSENGSKSSSDSYGGFMGGKPGGGRFPFSATTADDAGTSMKGIKAAGSILISNGAFTINSADDAIHSNGSITINGGTLEIAAGDDGINAGDTLTVTAGTISITESYEGLEAAHIDIRGGDIRLISTDDGINAAGGTDSSGTAGGRDGMFGKPGGMSSSNGTISVSGGNIHINMGGDGIDANGSVTITGGTITVSGANSGDTSILDFDTTGDISGGTFIGTGAASMAQNFSSSSTQGAIMVAMGSHPAGTDISLTDSDGNVLLTHTADRAFSCVIISHASIVKGGTYTLTVGSSTTDITMSGTVYGSGDHGGMGGRPGGRW